MENHKPSSTAKLVSNGLWLLSNRGLLPELMQKYVTAMTLTVNTYLFSPKSTLGHNLLKMRLTVMQKLALPHFFLHFLRRKLAIEDLARQTIADGAQQLVVVGAGYDTLSLRLAKTNPQLKVFEIDHPATQNIKRKAIKTLDEKFHNLHFISGDLSITPLEQQLKQHPQFDSQKYSVFVAEGLLMYLSQSEVKATFASIANCATKASFIFSFMKVNSVGNYQFEGMSKAASAYLTYKRELFRWGIPIAKIERFLQDQSYKLIDLKYRDDLTKYLPPNYHHLPLAEGENIALATINKKRP